MTNNETITRRCDCCKISFTTSRDENKQYNFELNGYCSYSCEARMTDYYNDYDRRYKP